MLMLLFIPSEMIQLDLACFVFVGQAFSVTGTIMILFSEELVRFQLHSHGEPSFPGNSSKRRRPSLIRYRRTRSCCQHLFQSLSIAGSRLDRCRRGLGNIMHNDGLSCRK